MSSMFLLFISLLFLLLVSVQKLRKFHQEYATLPGLNVVSSLRFLYLACAVKNVPLPTMIFQVINGCCKLFENEDLCVSWVAIKPYILVYKAEAVKVLINHPAAYDRPQEYQLANFFIGESFFLSNGDIHRNRRKFLNPAFDTVSVKNFIPIFNEQSAIMVKKLQRLVHEPSADVDEVIDLCMIDTIFETATGYRLETQKGNEEGIKYKDAYHTIASLLVSRMFLPWCHFDYIFWISSIGRVCRRALNITQSLIQKVIQEKKNCYFKTSSDGPEDKRNVQTVRRKMFIDMLLDHHMKDRSFTSRNIMDEVMMFLGAGEETSGVTVKNVILLLGLHPDVQENVIQELDSIFEKDQHGDVTYYDLANMKYMECVIKETLRIFPAVPIIARELSEDIRIGKHLLPRGSSIVFNIYQLHRDPHIFPNPEKFQPERFYSENCAKRHPFAYIPFSTGGRNCIGQKFAMAEMKILLSHMFRNFRVSAIDHRDQIDRSLEIILKTNKHIRVHLTPR